MRLIGPKRGKRVALSHFLLKTSNLPRPGRVMIDMIQKRAIAGLKMAHMLNITSAFEFWSAHPDGARVGSLLKNSKSFVLLCICTIFILLNCSF